MKQWTSTMPSFIVEEEVESGTKPFSSIRGSSTFRQGNFVVQPQQFFGSMMGSMMECMGPLAQCITRPNPAQCLINAGAGRCLRYLGTPF
jgi:hypothetical protein